MAQLAQQTTPVFSGAKTRVWDDEHGFVLFVEAESACASTVWFAEHRQKIRDALDRFGVVFLRGFSTDSHQFEATIDALMGKPMSYAGGVTPRSSVHGSVYTATDAPPDLAIVQHHEMSYNSDSPRYLCFYCDTPPVDGGATPVCDGRRFGRTMEQAAPQVMKELETKGVLFVRNYNEANSKGWREAWYTSDRVEVERQLRDAHAQWDWLSDEWLQTRQRLPAVVQDPSGGARVLFSCIHLWHRSYVKRMNASTGIELPDDPAKQPYATFFGDGSIIPESFISLMHETYTKQSVAIPYQKNDIMMVNNLLATHGRQPYTPPRKIYVTMREKVALKESCFCQPMNEEYLNG